MVVAAAVVAVVVAAVAEIKNRKEQEKNEHPNFRYEKVQRYKEGPALF